MTFAEHLEAATELVKSWPEWKRRALREALSSRKGAEDMKYRYDPNLGIVDEEGLQVLQLSANYSTDDFKDRAGNLLAKALNKESIGKPISRADALQISRRILERAERERTEQRFACDHCGLLRTASEGGTIFALCDECWDKHFGEPRP